MNFFLSNIPLITILIIECLTVNCGRRLEKIVQIRVHRNLTSYKILSLTKPRKYNLKVTCLQLCVLMPAFNPSPMGGRGKQISVNSRVAWFTKWVPGKTGLHNEIHSHKQNHSNNNNNVVVCMWMDPIGSYICIHCAQLVELFV